MTGMTERVAAALLELEGLPFPKVGSCDYDAAMRRARVAIAATPPFLQDELEHLYTLSAESSDLAPSSYGAGYDSGKCDGMKAAIEILQEDKP